MASLRGLEEERKSKHALHGQVELVGELKAIVIEVDLDSAG
jgi:hypothetical protein